MVFMEFESLVCRYGTERGESFKINFWLQARQFINPPQGALIVCRKQGPSGEERKTVHLKLILPTMTSAYSIHAGRLHHEMIEMEMMRYGQDCESLL